MRELPNALASRRLRREPGASAPGKNTDLRGLQARALCNFLPLLNELYEVLAA